MQAAGMERSADDSTPLHSSLLMTPLQKSPSLEPHLLWFRILL